MLNNAVYQRTEIGRQEIRHKSHGLTQSERLVLIMVDGVSQVENLRLKMRGLASERIDRALKKLQTSNLIQEILLPVDNSTAEVVEDDVAELFLRQDALDPVTIISIDPEDEFGSQPTGTQTGAHVGANETFDPNQWIAEATPLAAATWAPVTEMPVVAPAPTAPVQTAPLMSKATTAGEGERAPSSAPMSHKPVADEPVMRAERRFQDAEDAKQDEASPVGFLKGNWTTASLLLVLAICLYVYLR